jgi:hypothetical protein
VSWDSDALRTPATAYAQTLAAIKLLSMRQLGCLLMMFASSCVSPVEGGKDLWESLPGKWIFEEIVFTDSVTIFKERSVIEFFPIKKLGNEIYERKFVIIPGQDSDDRTVISGEYIFYGTGEIANLKLTIGGIDMFHGYLTDFEYSNNESRTISEMHFKDRESNRYLKMETIN